MNEKHRIACVCLAVLSIAGCGSRKAVVKDTFLIEAKRQCPGPNEIAGGACHPAVFDCSGISEQWSGVPGR